MSEIPSASITLKSMSDLSNEDRYAYDTIKLREIKGHEWWLITLLIIMFFSPFISIFISSYINYPKTPKLIYLIVSFFLILVWFFLHFSYYRTKVQDYETSSKDGTVYRIGDNKVVDEKWDEIWKIYNLSRRKRIRKYIIGLLRLELFGWITWTTAVVIAISEQLASTRNLNSSNTYEVAQSISNKINSNSGNTLTTADINAVILQQLGSSSQNLWEHFSIVMENASYGLARATVLGVITLFFTQMLKFYQANISLNYSAAESAKKAANDSNDAIGKIEKFRTTLHSELQTHKDIIKSSYGIVDGEWLFFNLIKLTSDVRVGSIKLAKLIEPIKTQIQKITEELAESNKDEDKTEFTALTVLQSTYFETEALNFEQSEYNASSDEITDNTAKIRKGVRLSTNFTHYIKTVQAMVDAFEEESPNTYQYFTILNETQEGFFNIEKDKVNLHWQVSFLEEQCRKHSDKDRNIYFQRYFTECSNSPENRGKLYPPKHSVEGTMEYILCDEEKNPKLYINPNQLKTDVKRVPPNACLTFDQYRVIGEINEERLEEDSSVKEKFDLKRDIFTREPSYIIKIEEKSSANQFATSFKQQLKNKGVNDLQFEKLTDILIANYHSKVAPPKIVKFDNPKVYDEFFGSNIPRDLVAVRKDGKWKFCLGVMIGSDIPTVVTLVFLTENRELKDLSWNYLTQKLDILFEINKDDYLITNKKITHAPFN